MRSVLGIFWWDFCFHVFLLTFFFSLFLCFLLFRCSEFLLFVCLLVFFSMLFCLFAFLLLHCSASLLFSVFLLLQETCSIKAEALVQYPDLSSLNPWAKDKKKKSETRQCIEFRLKDFES